MQYLQLQLQSWLKSMETEKKLKINTTNVNIISVPNKLHRM